jgi:hypothetical protein
MNEDQFVSEAGDSISLGDEARVVGAPRIGAGARDRGSEPQSSAPQKLLPTTGLRPRGDLRYLDVRSISGDANL